MPCASGTPRVESEHIRSLPGAAAAENDEFSCSAPHASTANTRILSARTPRQARPVPHAYVARCHALQTHRTPIGSTIARCQALLLPKMTKSSRVAPHASAAADTRAASYPNVQHRLVRRAGRKGRSSCAHGAGVNARDSSFRLGNGIMPKRIGGTGASGLLDRAPCALSIAPLAENRAVLSVISIVEVRVVTCIRGRRCGVRAE